MTENRDSPRRRKRTVTEAVKDIRSELVDRYGPDWLDFAERWLEPLELEVLKRRYEGQTQREVGSALGISNWSVGHREQRARRILRYRLSEYGRDGFPDPEPGPRLVRDLGLSSRIFWSLIEEEVETIEDLVALRRSEVLRIAGIGPSSLRKIEACLEQLGLSLAPEQPSD